MQPLAPEEMPGAAETMAVVPLAALPGLIKLAALSIAEVRLEVTAECIDYIIQKGRYSTGT